jgi:dolichol kinase
MALISICACGDTAAAIVGTKYGRHKFLRYNREKSVEGCIAGFIVSFILGTLFAGPFMGIIGASIFIAVDFITPKPIHITDNILNPLIIGSVFVFALPLTIPMFPFF